MAKILSIGEVMLEMCDMGNGLYKKSFAGDSFNVAHYLNVVTDGRHQVEYLTAVGMDAESESCLQFLLQQGVATTRCLRDPNHNIGLFILSNDEDGEKLYGYWRGDSAARHLFDEIQNLSGYDLICFSGITAAITINKKHLIQSLAAAKENRPETQFVYDFNHRKLLWGIASARDFAEQILAHMAIVKISDEELNDLFQRTTVSALSKQYPNPEWVFTCGKQKGEVWQNGSMLAQHLFAPVEQVLDSSAAGDSFIATYIAAKLAGATALDCLKQGHAVASQVVCGKGSIVDIDLTKLD